MKVTIEIDEKHTARLSKVLGIEVTEASLEQYISDWLYSVLRNSVREEKISDIETIIDAEIKKIDIKPASKAIENEIK